jgi:hypothetical protein
MKAAAEYASIDAIHNDGELNVVQRGKLVGEWMVLHLNDPQPLPVPDSDERRRLGDLRSSLASAHAAWTALETREKNFADWMPDATAKLRTLESTTQPDCDDATIDELNRLARRIQLGRTCESNFGPQRRDINSQIIAAFFALNSLIRKFSTERLPRQFFLSGISPVNIINEALDCIERLLNEK